MQVYDIIMLLVLGAAIVIGWRKGFATQVASLLSIGLSYFVAVNFRDTVAGQIDAAPPWNTFAAMLILYLGTSLLVWIFFQQVRSTIDQMKLKEFDFQLGALLGGAKGVVLCVVITLFGVSLLTESQRQTIIQSRSGFYIAQLLSRTESVFPEEIRQVLGPYMRELEGAYPGWGSMQAGWGDGGYRGGWGQTDSYPIQPNYPNPQDTFGYGPQRPDLNGYPDRNDRASSIPPAEYRPPSYGQRRDLDEWDWQAGSRQDQERY